MKNLIILISLIFTSSLLSDELSWVDEQVQAIKPARSGMKNRDIAKIKDPFIFLLKNRDEEEIIALKTPEAKAPEKTTSASTNATNQNVKSVNKILSLGVIMNSSAMINGEWYKVGDVINGYKVSDVSSKSVLLTKNTKELLLSTKSINKNLNFKNK